MPIRLPNPAPVASQRPIDPSRLLDTSRPPAGAKATLRTGWEWPVRGRSGRASRPTTCHKRTVLSAPEEASTRPSGLKATPVTPLV